VAAVILVVLAVHTARSALRKPATPTGGRPVPDARSTVVGNEERVAAGPSRAMRPEAGPLDAAGRDRTGLTTLTTPRRAYLGVLGLTLLNPATIVYFAALVLGRGGTGGGVWFVAGAFLASASWQLLIAGGGALVGRLLTGERGRLITALISSAVIAVLAVALIW
jgi:arginine exporter protein ArgO